MPLSLGMKDVPYSQYNSIKVLIMDNPIKNTEKAEAFITWGDESDKQEALSQVSDNLGHYDGVQKSLGGFRRSFLDIDLIVRLELGLPEKTIIVFDLKRLYLKDSKKPYACAWPLMTRLGLFVMSLILWQILLDRE